jgi:hypothetical protein
LKIKNQIGAVDDGNDHDDDVDDNDHDDMIVMMI